MPTKLELEKDKLLKEADNLVSEAIAKKRERLDDKIHAFIEKELNNIIMQHMGMRENFGSVSVDPRSDSPIKNLIQEKVEAMLPAYLDKFFRDLPPLSGKALKSLQSYYLSELKDTVMDRLACEASDKADEIVKDVVGDLG